MAVNRIQQGHMPTAFSAAACAPPSVRSFQSPLKPEQTPRASFLVPKLTLEDCFSWDRPLKVRNIVSVTFCLRSTWD